MLNIHRVRLSISKTHRRMQPWGPMNTDSLYKPSSDLATVPTFLNWGTVKKNITTDTDVELSLDASKYVVRS